MAQERPYPLNQRLDLKKVYNTFIAHIAPHVYREIRSGKDLRTPEWDEIVFGFFYNLGKKCGCKVETNWRIKKKFDQARYESYYKKYREKPHEYLVDFCGWKLDKSQYWLDFAVELEWQPERPSEDLDEDFYKLLDIKAHTKIGIGGCTKKGVKLLRRDEVKQLLDIVGQLLQNSPWRREEEGYLFIFMDNFSGPGAGISGHFLSGNGKVQRELKNEYEHIYKTTVSRMRLNRDAVDIRRNFSS